VVEGISLSGDMDSDGSRIMTYANLYLWRDLWKLPSQFTVHFTAEIDTILEICIFVNKSLPLNQRPILCSCETFRKRLLTSDFQGQITENFVHGIASVSASPNYRHRGYARRMMRELASVLRAWQILSTSHCVGTILYSDIGKSYYANLGWRPDPTNSHIEFPAKASKMQCTSKIFVDDLDELCERDEARVRKRMAIATSEDIQKCMTIIPDLDHMLWQMSKVEFAANCLFDRIPHTKGAIIGKPGRQLWALWTHRYYDHPQSEAPANILYKLRLVIESDMTTSRPPSDAGKIDIEQYSEQLGNLRMVLKAAQAEAMEWKLGRVRLWDATPLVRKLIAESGIDYLGVEREEERIASGRWYQDGGEASEPPMWINNEPYAWI